MLFLDMFVARQMKDAMLERAIVSITKMAVLIQNNAII